MISSIPLEFGSCFMHVPGPAVPHEFLVAWEREKPNEFNSTYNVNKHHIGEQTYAKMYSLLIGSNWC